MATYPIVKQWTRGLQIDFNLLSENIARMQALVLVNSKERKITLKC